MADRTFSLDEPYAGLIFDCDGTLVDTAPIHFFSVNEAMRPLGFEMSREWYFARVGLTPAALFAEFEEANGVKIDTADLSYRFSAELVSVHPLQSWATHGDGLGMDQ